MRIKQTSQVTMDTQRVSSAGGKSGAGGFGHQFQRHLQDTNTAEYEAYIQELTEKIYEQGEGLTKKVDVAEFQKYRELITQLFNEAASNSYMFCKSDKFDQRGRHKVITVIRKVNQRLDEIAEMILKNQAENLDLLNAVDDIRGMLVDMML